MHISASNLIGALKEAPENQLMPRREVSEYVLEHIFMPLRRGDPIIYANLDFEAFSGEDLNDLRDWIEMRDHISRRLEDLTAIFRAAKPVSRPGRAFC